MGTLYDQLIEFNAQICVVHVLKNRYALSDIGLSCIHTRDGCDETFSPLRVISQLMGFLEIFPRPVSEFQM